jgi:hypothetical protein
MMVISDQLLPSPAYFFFPAASGNSTAVESMESADDHTTQKCHAEAFEVSMHQKATHRRFEAPS